MLASKNTIALAISLNEWVNQVLAIPGLNLIDLSIPILTENFELLHYPYKDSVDRLIISSSRHILFVNENLEN